MRNGDDVSVVILANRVINHVVGDAYVKMTKQRAAVPYLYGKMFRTSIYRDGHAMPMTVTALLRYRHVPVVCGLDRFDQRLRERKLLSETPVGGGLARAIDVADCLKAGLDAMNEDMHFFLAEPPSMPTRNFLSSDGGEPHAVSREFF